MKPEVHDPQIAAAFDAITAGLDTIHTTGFDPTRAADAVALISELEGLSRRLDAAKVELLAAVDGSGVYATDGHASAKVMVRHVAKLSAGAAANRDRIARMLRSLPLVRMAFAAGEVAADHIGVLARVHSNPRVRDHMADREQVFLTDAATMDYPTFEATVRQWERLTDADGPEPESAKAHEQRDAKMVQDPIELGWHLSGFFGSLQGVEMFEVFNRYLNAEHLTDWRLAREKHGDAATRDHLERTDAQRRADALAAIFADAANNPEGPAPAKWVHNLVWDPDTYREALNRVEGKRARRFDPDTYRCETLNGHPVDPIEAAVGSLFGRIRRVVIDAPAAKVDLGRARLFTGAARDAVHLQSRCCIWPGCWVPVTDCQTDHITQHSHAGRTHPGNGAPLCGRHNRWKQQGYTITRDPSGTWHVTKPDGTPLE